MTQHKSRRSAVASLFAAGLACAPAAALTVGWVGPTTDANWSTAANWSTLATPAAPDDVFFGLIGSGGINNVDRDFLIRLLTYRADSTHRTLVSSGVTLNATGGVDIGVGDPSQSAAVTWGGGGRIVIGAAGAPARLWIGVNNSGAASGTTIGSLTLEDISVGGFINDLSIGRKAAFPFGQSFESNSNASLILGSNSTLTVGTAAARANVFLGYNPQTLGSASGLLDARQGTVAIHANEFNLGYSASTTGGATGTLRWNSPNTLDVTNFYISRGMGSGVLELAAGATFTTRTSFLGLAYNDSGSATGTTQANLDLTVNNPNFSAFVASDLSIGRKAAFPFGQSFESNSNASLILGSNSTLTVGTAAARANVFLGYNPQTLGSASGLLDARQGTVAIHANEFNLGYSASTTGGATGTLRWNSPNTLDVTNFYISRGMGSGVLELAAGATFTTRTSFLGLAYNDSGSATGTTQANLDLTVNNPNFSAFVASDLSIGRKAAFPFGQSFESNSNASLILGSNSTLTVGTAAARANVFLGYNPQTLGSASGLLDARQGTVAIHANEFNLGYSASTTGGATGTLRWNSPNTLDVTNFYISRGMGSGVLELAAGATFTTRTSFLGLAYNDSGSATGTTQANLDLTVNNPNFSAFVASDLSIGRKAAFPFGQSFESNSNASLILGSNSTLTVGTAAARANVFLGYNPQTLGSASGLLDARQGSLTSYASTVNVGLSSGGAASATFYTGANTAIDTATLNIGTGNTNATGIFHLGGGVLTAATTNIGANGAFDFTGGRFNAKLFNGSALVQKGGTLAPGLGSSLLTVSQGGYSLASAGVLEIDLLGTTAGTLYDQMQVNGSVILNSDSGLGGRLAVLLGFSPTIGTPFTIIDNDAAGPVLGTFAGLAEGASFSDAFGQSLYTFRISYVGGNGNDVVLNLSGIAPVPEPPTSALLLAGAAGMLWWRRRGMRRRTSD